MSGHDTPAFPTLRIDGIVEDGINIRDYFAAKAMAAYMAQCAPFGSAGGVAACAYSAYEMADAMLKVRAA